MNDIDWTARSVDPVARARAWDDDPDWAEARTSKLDVETKLLVRDLVTMCERLSEAAGAPRLGGIRAAVDPEDVRREIMRHACHADGSRVWPEVGDG